MSNPTELPDLNRRTHELKTDPLVFAAVMAGAKTHEIRLNDRGFQTGDDLLLRETTYTGEQMSRGYPLHYTGRTTARVVSHIQTGYGLADGWCILSFARCAQPEGKAITLLKDAARAWNNEASPELDAAMERIECFLLGSSAQPEGEAPQADWPKLLEAIAQGWDDADVGGQLTVNVGTELRKEFAVALRAATLSPLCGAQHAESGKEAANLARYQWLKDRFTGYDFYWGGDPMAEMDEDRGKCVIVFECGQDFRAGRDFEQGIDAAISRAAQLDGGQEGSAT